MSHSFELSFRGKTREVQYDYEGDGVYVWWFTENLENDPCGEGFATEEEREFIVASVEEYDSDWCEAYLFGYD